MALPTWPPKLTEAQIADLTLQSSTYAFAHGFTLIPPESSSPPTSVIAAPLSLLPTPFPRAEYTRARDIQQTYNALYARVALDWELLDSVMSQVAEVDSFQKELWTRWKAIREEIAETQVGAACCVPLTPAAAAWDLSLRLPPARGGGWCDDKAGRVQHYRRVVWRAQSESQRDAQVPRCLDGVLWCV